MFNGTVRANMKPIGIENGGAKIGIYRSKTNQLMTNYVRPQENGNRSDARWLIIADNITWGA